MTLTIQQARELLGDEAAGMTDAQVWSSWCSLKGWPTSSLTPTLPNTASGATPRDALQAA